MTQDQRVTLQMAIDKYGTQKQSMVAMEECAELIQAISKMQRKGSLNNLIEEMADVLIMIEQLKMMFCIKNSVVEKVVDAKIERLSTNMSKGE